MSSNRPEVDPTIFSDLAMRTIILRMVRGSSRVSLKVESIEKR